MMSKIHYASIAATGEYLPTKAGKCLPIQIAFSVPYVVYQDEAGHWLADFPSLGNMAQGDSEEHVRIAAEEGIAMLVRAMFSRGVVPGVLTGGAMTVEAKDTVAEKVARRNPVQLNLGQVIEKLRLCQPQKPVYAAKDGSDVVVGVCAVGSYRGYYDQLAIEPMTDDAVYRFGSTSAHDMAKILNDATNQTFQGYKGGDYDMDKYTPVWVSGYGLVSGDMVVAVEEQGDRVLLLTSKEP